MMLLYDRNTELEFCFRSSNSIEYSWRWFMDIINKNDNNIQGGNRTESMAKWPFLKRLKFNRWLQNPYSSLTTELTCRNRDWIVQRLIQPSQNLSNKISYRKGFENILDVFRIVWWNQSFIHVEHLSLTRSKMNVQTKLVSSIN